MNLLHLRAGASRARARVAIEKIGSVDEAPFHAIESG
jgi:hypothetical protein